MRSANKSQDSMPDPSGFFTSHEYWQQFDVYVSTKEVHFTIVITKNTRTTDHEPLYEPSSESATENRTMRRGLHVLERVTFSIPEKVRKAYRRQNKTFLMKTSNDLDGPLTKRKRCMSFIVCVVARHNDSVIEFGLKIAEPKDILYDGKLEVPAAYNGY